MTQIDNVYMDFETKSNLDLSAVGAIRYLTNKLADIVCLGIKVNDGKTILWKPGDDLPDAVKNTANKKYYAFNAVFDYRVWNLLGKRYGFPKLYLSQMIDVMALCGRFTYPQNLEAAGDALKLDVQKNTRGKDLIKKICCPPFIYTAQDLKEFYAYCITDVDSMYEMINALPASKLSDKEQALWELTMKINNKGLPIDINMVHQIIKVTEAYKTEQNVLLPSLTDGAVTKATQTKRIKTWINAQGVKIPNTKKETVKKYLNGIIPKKIKDIEEKIPLHDIDTDIYNKLIRDLAKYKRIRSVLELRQELGRSSTAKYTKIVSQYYNGYIYDNLRYYAALTGRWGGLGFQLHNLPRSDVKDPEPLIAKFYDYSIIEDNPVAAAKDLIRSAITAPKGKRICAVDYTAIENILLAYTVDDKNALDLLISGRSQYIDMAAFLSHKRYEDIEKSSIEYMIGKRLILGCGYGLGAGGFKESAENEGVIISMEESTKAVNAYRLKYIKVKNFWYACQSAAINAVRFPKKSFTVHGVKFRTIVDRNGVKWLQVTLHSGRSLYYNKPIIDDGKYGPCVSHMGINPYTKQWCRMQIRPGAYVGHIIQGTARDILAHGKLNLDKAGYTLIGSVHDEPILEIDKDQDCLDEVRALVCDLPEWAKNIPIKADGMILKRYIKM